MAWPYTPLTTYVANSVPAVKATDLNSMQSAINDLYTGLALPYVILHAGTGASPANRYSVNVASITRNGTGRIDVTMSNALPAAATSGGLTDNAYNGVVYSISGHTTAPGSVTCSILFTGSSAFSVYTWVAGTLSDSVDVSLMIYAKPV